MVSVSIGADVREILRRFVHFEHTRHDETRRYVTMGCHKLSAGVLGKAPDANGFFVTVRRSAWHGLCDRNSVCLSVRPSVCPSVTLVDCVHTV